MPFESVLVANRGEIAVRITRTLRTLGIRSIAVFSDADRSSRHVTEADAALAIGPASAVHSYLAVDRIIDAALRSGAQALHPGYGFLAENAALAEACADAGIVFVGPPVAAIEAMGDKIRAKQLVAAHGVAVVPGASGVGLDDGALVSAALGVGLPLLIKPSAGGGGKGMRLVTSADDLADQISGARREARAAFGDDTLLVERYVERPRHIEVQVLADTHGNVVHIGERECTLQRRHQKVIEEAPSPYLTDSQRTALGEQAVAAARSVGYVSAGTVEFIVSGERPDEAFFLEMNTRLQVEHPVTEMVWGLDLVEQQLRIAAGEPLSRTQADLRPTGHAFEARVYAEDADHGFLPTGGTVHLLREPVDLAHVRVDSSLTVGSQIGSDYDPMLSKVIAWGADRDSARRRLGRALAETTVLGVTTNVAFLRTVLDDADVATGEMDTGLVERIAAGRTAPRSPPQVVIAAALVHLVSTPVHAPWADRHGWRIGEPASLTWNAVDSDGEPVSVTLRSSGSAWETTIDGEPQRVTARRDGNRLHVDADGATTEYAVTVVDETIWIGHGGAAWSFAPPAADHCGAAADPGELTLVSPLPGTVVTLQVSVGDELAVGHPVVVVEAMKMEHTLRAPTECVVSEVLVRAGDRVGLRQHLVVLDAVDRSKGEP